MPPEESIHIKFQRYIAYIQKRYRLCLPFFQWWKVLVDNILLKCYKMERPTSKAVVAMQFRKEMKQYTMIMLVISHLVIQENAL